MKISKTTQSVIVIVSVIILLAIIVACSQFGCSNSSALNVNNEPDWEKVCTEKVWIVKENYAAEDDSVAEYITSLNTLTFVNNDNHFSVIINKETDTQVGPFDFSFTDAQNGVLTTICSGNEVNLLAHFSQQDSNMLTLETPNKNKIYLLQ